MGRIVTVLALAAGLFLAGCSDGAAKSKAVNAISDAQGQVTSQGKTLHSLAGTKGVKSDPQAIDLTKQAQDQNGAIAKDLHVAKPAAAADANKAAAADNAVVVRLTWIGIGLFVFGLAAGLGGILATGYLGVVLAAYFRTGGAVVAGTGLATLYLAYHWAAFNKAVDIVVVTGVVAGIVYVIVHYVSASEVTAAEEFVVGLFTKAVKGVKGLFTKKTVPAASHVTS